MASSNHVDAIRAVVEAIPEGERGPAVAYYLFTQAPPSAVISFHFQAMRDAMPESVEGRSSAACEVAGMILACSGMMGLLKPYAEQIKEEIGDMENSAVVNRFLDSPPQLKVANRVLGLTPSLNGQ